MIVMMLCRVGTKMDEATEELEYVKWLNFGAYFTITYVLSLRGTEGLLLDLGGMIKKR
jgi:hypothetical protein